MRQLLNSDLELLVDSGFVYVPLLFDPAIARELRVPLDSGIPQGLSKSRAIKPTIEIQGRHFVRTLSLLTLIENYEKINPGSTQQLRNAFLQEYYLTPEFDGVSADGKLRTIIFKIMPYFIKKNRGLERRRLTDEEMLDLIGKKINIPQRYYQMAETFLDMDPLYRMLNGLKEHGSTPKMPENGLLLARDLQRWVHKALQARIVQSEKECLRKALYVREQFKQTKKRHLKILLYIAGKGSLEIDGFGFLRTGSSEEYLVYKHTGEYILKDYYARSYLFPDCRVAVSTTGPLRPIVVETYKHPFLRGHNSGQEICLRGFNPPKQFTVNNVINVLEEGINALLYGYDGRRRNGQHSLDRTRLHVRGIEFDDYRI